MKTTTHLALAALACGAFGCARINPARGSLRTAIDARNAELIHCYGETLARDPSAGGEMNLWVTVPGDQIHPTAVEVERSEVQDQALVGCVGDTIRSVQLSEPPPIDMRVHYVLVFRSGGAPPPPAVRGGDDRPPPPPAVRGGEEEAPPPPAVRGGG